MKSKTERIYSTVWREEAEENDPFVAAKCYLSGYDVFGDLLGKVSWIEYLYLLFRREAPSAEQAALLNSIAVAIASNGPRDLSAQAATSAAAGGSTLASCLTAALAVGAGQYGGGREVHQCMTVWQTCEMDEKKWQAFLSQDWPIESSSIWSASEHPFGFDPNAVSCATPIKQALTHLASISPVFQRLTWLQSNRQKLEDAAQMPLALTGVASCALLELGLHPQEGEMLFLLLRLPGAAVFALEQHWRGWVDYPFHQQGLKLSNDPGPDHSQQTAKREEVV